MVFPTALLWYLLTLEREFTSGKSRHVRQTTTIAVRKVIKASGNGRGYSRCVRLDLFQSPGSLVVRYPGVLIARSHALASVS